ncbi:MAG: MCP four helix bundle domain-containing protein [Flavobacteriales bacterium]|nr:MCP four helix bundle domain-containing protein [Flavobacteriales bacterium]
MKWTYTIKNKLLASGVLLVLCLLVLLSHYLDKIHTENVKKSITTLYEDRLIAEDYILKMTSNTYQIREVLHSEMNDDLKLSTIKNLLDDFNKSYTVYIVTKLTTKENTLAKELVEYIKHFEQIFSKNNLEGLVYTNKVLVLLNKLSDVQLNESKLIMKNAESEYSTIKSSSQFAFAIIILILVVLQAIVFSSKSLIPITHPKDPKLN